LFNQPKRSPIPTYSYSSFGGYGYFFFYSFGAGLAASYFFSLGASLTGAGAEVSAASSGTLNLL
jgi:hypothetical protein